MQTDNPPPLFRQGTIRAYILFHDQDRKHRDALERHLKGLVRANLLSRWDRSHFDIGNRESVEDVASRHGGGAHGADEPGQLLSIRT